MGVCRQAGFGHKTFESLGITRPHRSCEQQRRVLVQRKKRVQAMAPDEQLEEFMAQQQGRIRRLQLSGYRDRTEYFDEEPSIREQMIAGELEVESRT